MKIGDVRSTTRTSRVAGKKSVGDGKATASPASPVDQVVLMGIPSVELTPKVRTALMTLMAEVQELRAELSGVRARISDLEELADRDPLLDIYNRRAFVRELDRVLAMIDRYGVRASLIFVDLNDLKKINDGKGHAAGDAALGLVAEVITTNIRQTDAVGRLGGDEFGVLLLQSDQTQAEKKAQHLSEALAGKIVNWREGAFGIGISWGAVEIVKGVSAEQAMEHADSAMYKAKRSRTRS